VKYKLQELIDIDQFQGLQDKLNSIYSFPSSIIDNEGNILTATAWQDICTNYHRKNKISQQLCINSDQYIKDHLHEANPAVSYRCPHGLVDAAAPIIIDGIHYANFFTGQFFLEEPDLDFFRLQARKYHFDERKYLDAVKKVPIWTQEQLDNYLIFINGLIAVISESGLKKLKEIENRKKIEGSEKRHRSILKTAMDGFWLSDSDGRLLEVNDSYCSMSKYTAEELLSMRINDLEALEDADMIALHMKKIAEKGSDRFESRHRRKDGTIYDVEVSAKFWPDEGGRSVCFIRDITERKQAEEALKNSREELRKNNQLLAGILDHTHMMAVFLDPEFNFMWVNRAYAATCRQEPSFFPGKNHFDLYPHDENQEIFQRVVNTGQPCFVAAKPFYFPDQPERGVTYWDWSLIPIKDNSEGVTGLVFTLAEVTERIQAEEEREKLQARLTQAQKMESIGRLAGGIAHDFNNILSIIVGNTELAGFDIPDWSPVQENLKEILEASLRARDLVTQILLFAQQKDHVLAHIRVEPVVRESLRMLRASIPTTVEIRQDIQERLPSVFADTAQIQQIIMNLCTNACHVLESQGGTLAVTVDLADLDTPLDTLTGCLPEGSYVRILVRDTGPGIAPENLERIFEPFFTTKGVGEGTGLGLAVVHGIVLDRRGGITVESAPGQGTAFSVYLPASNEVFEEESAEEKPELPNGTERILFVDDEPMITGLGRRVLERRGYEVETRASGVDALEYFRRDPHRFDLVVTDMTMPGLRGDMLAKEIMSIRPEMPVILSTGYSSQISEEKAEELGVRAFVMKPLTARELLSTVRRVLDE